jgi:hypothetical protein
LVDTALQVLLDRVGVAPVAWYGLEDLELVTVLVLVLHVANIDEALIAAVRRLIGENFGGRGAYT